MIEITKMNVKVIKILLKYLSKSNWNDMPSSQVLQRVVVACQKFASFFAKIVYITWRDQVTGVNVALRFIDGDFSYSIRSRIFKTCTLDNIEVLVYPN